MPTAHSAVPLPAAPHELFEWLVERLLERYRVGSKADTRINFVLGSGSSIWSGLDTWSRDFKERLVTEAERRFPGFVTECWRVVDPAVVSSGSNLRQRLLDDVSIEHIAGVARRNGDLRATVDRLLIEQFTPHSVRRNTLPGSEEVFQPPQLAYELVAHFLKHGFIDHIVTFNFDELLDEALKNELGRQEFRYVASEHDVSIHPHKAAEPHLIKPHGTLSRLATLRMTPDEVKAFPEPMLALLDEVVLGRGLRDTPPKRNYIVSFGYSWKDGDIAQWLSARQDYVDGALIVALEKDCPAIARTFESRGWRPGIVRTLAVDSFCHEVPANQLTVDLFLWAAWRQLEQEMTDCKIPFMPASRHLILSYLFQPGDIDEAKEQNNLNSHTVLRRFVVEFALHLAKGKGMVNLSTMSGNERLARYYAELRGKHAGTARKIEQDLLRLLTAKGFIKQYQHGTGRPGGDDYTIQQSSYPDVKETYYSVARTPAELADAITGNDGFRMEWVYEPSYGRTANGGSITYKKSGKGEPFVTKQFEEIFNGPEIEVARRSSDRESWMLRAAKPLPTYIDLQNRTRAVLTNQDWTHLLVIAESGAWLAKESIEQIICSRAGRTLLLIEADQPSANDWPLRHLDIAEKLEESFERYDRRGVRIERLPLDWWEHNRHMTLAIDDSGPTPRCTGGIYFRRRHKKSRIQPLEVIPDAEDVSELMVTFLAYARRGVEAAQRTPAPADYSAFVRIAADLGGRMDHPQQVKGRITEVLSKLTDLTDQV